MKKVTEANKVNNVNKGRYLNVFFSRTLFTLFALLTLFTFSLWAASQRITYQGQLRENGLPVTGTKNIIFRIYPSSTSSSASWTSAAMSVSVTGGLFRVILEPSGVDWEGAPFLELQVEGAILSPREELSATPFGINALLHSGKKYTTAASAPSSPSVGDLWFDTSAGNLKFWSGSGWTSAAGAAGAHASTHELGGTDELAGALKISSITASPNALSSNFGALVVSTHIYQTAGNIFTLGRIGLGTTLPSSMLEVLNGSVTIRGSGAGLRVSNLSSCTAIETDAQGNLICGSDDGGASSLPLPEGATNYIQAGNTLQAGASFYVTSGSAQGTFTSYGGFIGSGAGLTSLASSALDTSSITKQGNVFNQADRLLLLDSSALIPNALINPSSVTKLGPTIDLDTETLGALSGSRVIGIIPGAQLGGGAT
ncbi:MAG: hypothetical protein HY401_08790, partial [Elusimicrobia bacterium]|nr:hypothetical protein [Elusimicrobiota bacterium]